MVGSNENKINVGTVTTADCKPDTEEQTREHWH